MQLPIFYQEIINSSSSFVLNEDTSKHVSQVLRMREGEKIQLTNGKGQLLTVEISHPHKRTTEVKVVEIFKEVPAPKKITIAISLLKNTSRFEWFVEKATEIGVTEIIPLICERTEKQQFRHDRTNNVIVSAMLQSRQVWLPKLSEPVKFAKVITSADHEQKFIAHCDEGNRKQMTDVEKHQSSVILIGPEGDFTTNEIEAAMDNKFTPVSLGETRLRSETAGVVAVTLLTRYLMS